MKKENDQLHKYIVTGVAFTHKNCVFDGGKRFLKVCALAVRKMRPIGTAKWV